MNDKSFRFVSGLALKLGAEFLEAPSAIFFQILLLLRAYLNLLGERQAVAFVSKMLLNLLSTELSPTGSFFKPQGTSTRPMLLLRMSPLELSRYSDSLLCTISASRCSSRNTSYLSDFR